MLGIAAAMMLSAAAASAQPAWPAKPVQFITGFPPGGATDTVARLVAAKLSERLGQQVIVDNRPGAGSNIGTAAAAKAPPDGYTIFLGTVANSINETLYKKLPFDFRKELAPVVLLVKLPNLVVVPADSPIKSVADLVAAAKQQPGKINFGSAGQGTSSHMSGAMFGMMAGIDIVHVPYRGTSPALNDLLGGRLDMMFDNLPAMLPHVQSGKLRALAVSTADRAVALPDIPTMQEAGIAGFESASWSGIIVPAGTPKEIVERLNRETNAALGSPDLSARLQDLGYRIEGGRPEDFGRFIAAEIDKWGKVVKETGVEPE
jgi:tripartite-type tricarboxylate transporter receptor subunit TctC